MSRAAIAARRQPAGCARLGDAVAALTADLDHPLPGAGSGWLPSRYAMLRVALYSTRGAGGTGSFILLGAPGNNGSI
jgi:hypothetical protein